jgi:uncharacterized NAD(P)/FAD-binding protein YdhS
MIRQIAIVGAGFSGVTTAINLLNASNTPIKVILIDATSPNGGGLAYSTFDDNFVLNVPAQNMSAFPERMDDFAQYCNEEDSALVASSFVSRRIYGDYLKQRLKSAEQASKGNLVIVKERVISLDQQQPSGYQLTCSSGLKIDAQSVVLAFGHFAPKPLDKLLPGKVNPQALVGNNPWDIHSIDSVPRDKDVLIVGTGHTAIDTLFRLESARADRRVFMLSRHGLHPHGHRPIGEFHKNPVVQKLVQEKVLDTLSRTPSLRLVMKVVRQLVIDLDVNWRDVLNAMRPITPEIWQRLTATEKSRFLRHVVPYWDVLRHRLSPQAIRRLNTSFDEGRCIMGAYAIQKIDAQDNGDVQVTARCRRTSRLDSFRVGAVINCSGPTYDISKTGNELVSFLANKGILKQDEMKIGFRVATDYTVNPNYPHIYYVGPMLKASYWEAIAVPELRVHSARLAQTILGISL